MQRIAEFHVRPLTKKHYPTQGVSAVVTLAADANNHHVLDGIGYSYIGTFGSNGKLTIAIAGSTVFEVDVTAKGPDHIPLKEMGSIASAKNQAVVVTLLGITTTTGKLNVLYR